MHSILVLAGESSLSTFENVTNFEQSESSQHHVIYFCKSNMAKMQATKRHAAPHGYKRQRKVRYPCVSKVPRAEHALAALRPVAAATCAPADVAALKSMMDEHSLAKLAQAHGVSACGLLPALVATACVEAREYMPSVSCTLYI
tara:strand:- start:354 stop:785 length:432 start_codon:yes stop_codon:yes gene_type:complete